MFVCPLTQIEEGKVCRLRQILGSPELCQKLMEIGFCDNVKITVVSKNLICQLCETKYGLCKKVAEKIIVEKICGT